MPASPRSWRRRPAPRRSRRRWPRRSVRRRRAPRAAGGAGRGCAWRARPRRPPRSPRARARGRPGSRPRGRGRARTRRPSGVLPSGGTSPFEVTSTALRSPTARRSRRPPQAGCCRERRAPPGRRRRTRSPAPSWARSPGRAPPRAGRGGSRARRAGARLRRGAAAELDLEPGAGEHRRDRGAHRAGADDGGRAQRRQAAEPLPLELDAGPDALGHLAGQERRRVVDARVGERRRRSGRAPSPA